MSELPEAWYSALIRAGATLIAGGLIGAYFDNVLVGILAAGLLLAAINYRELFRLERSLRLRQPIVVPDGTGIWAQVLARTDYLVQRIRLAKSRHRGLLREVRKSINAFPEGVILLNEDDEILRYNGAAQRLIGLKKRRDRGQRVDNLLRHPEFVAYLRSRDYKQRVTLPSPLSDDHWLACRIVPYSAGSRLLLLRDITGDTRLAKMRRDFVANASHELRSPLTVIRGYLDAFAEDAATAGRWQRQVDEMRTQAKRMENIITELLELSRLESGALAGRDHNVDVVTLLELARQEAGHSGGAASVALDIRSQKKLRGVSSELQSVVSNLVQNALRHTPASGTITLGWVDRKAGEAELFVEDTGEGIAESELPRLTERFYRVNRGRSRDQGGVGLGLAIVKHALNRHEAELRISSTLGSGSRFACRFPASRVTASATPGPMETKP